MEQTRCLRDALALYFCAVSFKFAVQAKVSSFTFDAQFFCLSAAQNAPPAGGQPAGGAFCAADKQKNGTS